MYSFYEVAEQYLICVWAAGLILSQKFTTGALPRSVTMSSKLSSEQLFCLAVSSPGEQWGCPGVAHPGTALHSYLKLPANYILNEGSIPVSGST